MILESRFLMIPLSPDPNLDFKCYNWQQQKMLTPLCVRVAWKLSWQQTYALVKKLKRQLLPKTDHNRK